MRKITKKAVDAFMQGRNFIEGNTAVSVGITGNVYLSLHGNNIAIRTNDGKLKITDANWQTKTTKERLNGIPGVSITQKDWQWYLNGEAWGGELIDVYEHNRKIAEKNKCKANTHHCMPL